MPAEWLHEGENRHTLTVVVPQFPRAPQPGGCFRSTEPGHPQRRSQNGTASPDASEPGTATRYCSSRCRDQLRNGGLVERALARDDPLKPPLTPSAQTSLRRSTSREDEEFSCSGM
jgi:hypothetical protein